MRLDLHALPTDIPLLHNLIRDMAEVNRSINERIAALEE
jgi:hypothetical protein